MPPTNVRKFVSFDISRPFRTDQTFRRAAELSTVIAAQRVLEILGRSEVGASRLTGRGRKDGIDPASQRVVEVGLSGNALSFSHGQFGADGILDAIQSIDT